MEADNPKLVVLKSKGEPWSAACIANWLTK